MAITKQGASGSGGGVTSPVGISDGGTASTTALNNNRFVVSSGSKIVEAAAVTASRVVVSDSNGLPTASSTTTTVLGYLDVGSSLTTLLAAKASATFVENIDAFIEGATNKTYVLRLDAKYGFTINEITIVTVSGTLTANLKIGSTSVTSLSSLSVTSTPQTVSATGANTVVAGNTLNLVITSISSPVDLQLSIKITRT